MRLLAHLRLDTALSVQNGVLKNELLAKLGKHSCGKGCLYIKRLVDIDMETLEELAARIPTHAGIRSLLAESHSRAARFNLR